MDKVDVASLPGVLVTSRKDGLMEGAGFDCGRARSTWVANTHTHTHTHTHRLHKADNYYHWVVFL